MEDDSSDDSCERLVDYRKTSTTTAAAAGNNSNNHKIREKKESAKEKTANEEEEDNDCAKNDDGNNNDPHNNQSSSSDGDDDDDDDEYWDPRQRPQPSVAASEAASHRNQKRRRRPAAATAPSHKKPKPRKKRVRQRVGLESRDMEENADTNNTANVFIPKHITVEQMIQTVGFCCAECYCNGDRGATRVWTDTDFGQSQTDGYYHRLCCHKTTVQAVRASEGTWCTMYDGANQDAFANMMSSNEALTRTSSCLSLVEEEQLRPRIESECCDDLGKSSGVFVS